MRNSKNSQAGLTLIELLVIISIIAVFAAMIPCAPLKAKSKAQRISCTNNQCGEVGVGQNGFPLLPPFENLQQTRRPINQLGNKQMGACAAKH